MTMVATAATTTTIEFVYWTEVSAPQWSDLLVNEFIIFGRTTQIDSISWGFFLIIQLKSSDAIMHHEMQLFRCCQTVPIIKSVVVQINIIENSHRTTRKK